MSTWGTKRADGGWDIDGNHYARAGTAGWGSTPVGEPMPVVWGDKFGLRQPLVLAGHEIDYAPADEEFTTWTGWPTYRHNFRRTNWVELEEGEELNFERPVRSIKASTLYLREGNGRIYEFRGGVWPESWAWRDGPWWVPLDDPDNATVTLLGSITEDQLTVQDPSGFVPGFAMVGGESVEILSVESGNISILRRFPVEHTPNEVVIQYSDPISACWMDLTVAEDGGVVAIVDESMNYYSGPRWQIGFDGGVDGGWSNQQNAHVEKRAADGSVEWAYLAPCRTWEIDDGGGEDPGGGDPGGAG